MANNRVHIVYRPTGDSLCLMKRMGWGWYPSARHEDLEQFLEACIQKCAELGADQDDFYFEFEEPPQGARHAASAANN